ncbi:MAG: Rieske (2Fe-2S) protein [Planctomycetales bacterium]|nr:Rieske (2Fe-2S) protein [Planctomycetales bacterium]
MSTSEPHNAPPQDASVPTSPPSVDQADRRSLLALGSTLLMTGGLAGGYGAFFTLAARYLFPTDSGKAWFFVAAAKSIPSGSSIDFTSPSGVRVTIRRDEGEPQDLRAENFLALSSVCPHLGCRVHWESANKRFFCPCHNGVFSPDGVATEGPPAQAGQNLPRYALKLDRGSLYIEMPAESV